MKAEAKGYWENVSKTNPGFYYGCREQSQKIGGHNGPACKRPKFIVSWTARIYNIFCFIQHINLGSAEGTTVRQILYFRRILESVTKKMLLQQAEYVKKCISAKTAYNPTDGSRVAANWMWVSITPAVQPWLWPYWQLFDPRKKHRGGLSDTASFAKPSVLYWRHTVIYNTLWNVPEPSGWLCGKLGHCSGFSS